MNCGILHEGKYDPSTIEKIVSTISFVFLGEQNISFSHFNARGTIGGSFNEAMSSFFELAPQCDFVVCFHDYDNNPRKLELLKKQRNRREDMLGLGRRIVIASPKPTLEQWFFIEETALKNVFCLNHSERIPHQDLNPKQRLMKLYAESDHDEVTSPNDIYEELAQHFDPTCQRLMGDRYYKLFHEELKLVLQSLS